jgi:hypothetical protein
LRALPLRVRVRVRELYGLRSNPHTHTHTHSPGPPTPHARCPRRGHAGCGARCSVTPCSVLGAGAVRGCFYFFKRPSIQQHRLIRRPFRPFVLGIHNALVISGRHNGWAFFGEFTAWYLAKQYLGLIAQAGSGARLAFANWTALSSGQWAPRRPGGGGLLPWVGRHPCPL